MKRATVTLTRPELDHLLVLLRDNEDEGSYYGPRAQWVARHDRLVNTLEKARVQQEPGR